MLRVGLGLLLPKQLQRHTFALEFLMKLSEIGLDEA